MRSEGEMMALILGAAQEDERVRAVMLNGSRANPNAPRDPFQDYDVVFVVRDVQEMVEEGCYADRFGPHIMLQMPETMRDPMGDGRFTYLTLLEDGNRIDLQLVPADRWERMLGRDSQTVALLDKDGILPSFPPASDRDYLPKPPAEKDYDSCCNEFWWCMQNVAKGIWRDELPFAMNMYHIYVRAQLHDMITWRIGQRTGFSACPGKAGKYFQKYLTPQEWRLYENTFSSGESGKFWDAVFAMCGLFRSMAQQVGAQAGFGYPQRDDDAMTAYLRHVRSLPRDAKEIY